VAIEFPCSTCRTLIRTPDESAGQTARCPRCGSLSTIPASGAAPNPFAESAVNPYATPAAAAPLDYGGGLGGPLTRDEARIRLFGPAIGILITVVVGTGFLLLFLLGVLIDPNVLQSMPNESGFEVFLVSVFVGGFLSHLVQLIGAIAMLRVRGKVWAMLGTGASFIPCNFYCCWLAFPFAIWSAIVLANPDVRAAFDRP
jgi:hypothetical protein